MSVASCSIAASIWPTRTWLHNIALVVGGSLGLAVLSQIAVPIGAVPITLQTLGVLLIGAAYGSRLGTATIAAYLAQGAVGLPVFAGGGAGLAWLFGPTSGYLFGFLLVAAVVGWITERGNVSRPVESAVRTVVAMALGTLIVYAPGLLVLNQFVPTWEQTLAAGLFPFLLGDALKFMLATAVVVATHRWVPTKRPEGTPARDSAS